MAKTKPASKEAPKPEVGWVIVNEKGCYLTVTKHGLLQWTEDADVALRLAREQDALMLASCNGDLNTLVGWRKVVLA